MTFVIGLLIYCSSARFVIDKNNERGEISLSLADGKQRLKDFALKDGVEGELISEIFNKDGDNAKVFAQDGVSEVEDARVPECLVVGRYLKVANVSYLLQSDQGISTYNLNATFCSVPQVP